MAALLDVRWSVDTHAREVRRRRRILAKQSVGTRSRQAARHATTAILSMGMAVIRIVQMSRTDMSAKKAVCAEYPRATPDVEMARGLGQRDVMTATRSTGTDARRHARWSAGMPARGRRPTHVLHNAGTAYEQATRHATTAIRSIMTDAAVGVRGRPGGLATWRHVQDPCAMRCAGTA